MFRPRRSSRNTGKKALECRERLRKCIADEDWDCSSEEEGDSDEEQGLDGDCTASTRSSVKRVACVIAKFDEQKKDLVKSIGFGGLLDLNQLNKLNRRLTIWLLSRLDTDNRTIEVDGEIQVEMVDFDVHRILGIPCGPYKVSPMRTDDLRARKMFMLQLMGASPNETNSLLAAGRLVSKDYGGNMDKKQCDSFKVAFVIFVVGHLLAPTSKNNVGNSSFWGALTVPDNISMYNWGEFVLEQLIEAAVKVQGDIRSKKKISNITGCSILLQVMYLETLKVPGVDKFEGVYPRIKIYSASYLNTLVEADKATTSSTSRKVSWGGTIGRRTTRIGRTNYEPALLDKLKGAGDISQNLAVFARDNFSGKLNDTHINALIAYGERCNTHFSTFKENMMKENLFLVEMLMSGSFKTTSDPIVSASTSHEGSMVPPQTDIGILRGYESSCEGRCATIGKKYNVADETMSTGNCSGHKTVMRSNASFSENDGLPVGVHGNTAVDSSNRGQNIGCGPERSTKSAAVYLDQPMFDLGIEFQTQEKNIVAKTVQVEQDNPNVGCGLQLQTHGLGSGTGQNIEVEPESTKSTAAVYIDPPYFEDGVQYQSQEKYMAAKKLLPGTPNLRVQPLIEPEGSGGNGVPMSEGPSTLAHTPACGKRKSNQLTWSSPDGMLNKSTTSPASMSKILADGAVFARMFDSEEGLDVNIQPWDHDTTDSPVLKKTVASERLAKSPWFHEMKHKSCPVEAAAGIWEKIMTGTGKSELDRIWISHRCPRFLEVLGSCIKDSFCMKTPFDYDLYDLAVRRLVQLDHTLYKDSKDKRWRHILESDFAVLAQASENPAFHKSIREQFYGPSVNYNINTCRMVVIPAQVLLNWCCYFWDFKKKVVHVIDPLYSAEESAYYEKLHGPITEKIGSELAKCISTFFDKWCVDWSEWKHAYVLPKIQVADRNETALISLMCTQEFDGEGFRNLTEGSYKDFKTVLLAEMLSMLDNQAKPPVVYSAPKISAPIVLTIDDD